MYSLFLCKYTENLSGGLILLSLNQCQDRVMIDVLKPVEWWEKPWVKEFVFHPSPTRCI